MDVRLPAAIVTVEDGVELVEVEELASGELVRRDGRALELVSVVVIVGLDEVSSAA